MSMLFRGQPADVPRQSEALKKLPKKDDSVLKLDLSYEAPATGKKQGLQCNSGIETLDLSDNELYSE